MVADLADWERTSVLLTEAISSRPVHYLVNCAAIRRIERFGELTEATLDEYCIQRAIFLKYCSHIFNAFLCNLRRQFAVGIKGTINVSQVLKPSLLDINAVNTLQNKYPGVMFISYSKVSVLYSIKSNT